MEKNKKKKHRALLWGLVLSVILAAMPGTVYLIGAGYAEVAINTVIRWGEDGTLDRFGVFIEETLPPILIAAGVGVGTILAALLPVIARIKKASEQMDTGTKVSVKTADLAEASRQEMKEHNEAMDKQLTAFMGEMQAREDARAAEQKATLDAFMKEMRADTAAERAKTRRIEGGVDKLLRVELLAHGADDSLVKKGVASEIARVADEHQPCDVEEGGEADEAVGHDGEAVEEAEASL